MKTTVITANCLRHKAFLKMLCDNIDVTSVIIENKKCSSDDFIFNKEMNYFGEYSDYKSLSSTFECEIGNVNNQNIENIIKKDNPDIIFVFGCSILKSNIFSIPTKGCINIHTGIVQLFRGVDSSFWAIHDKKPEGIGATIHYVDDSIDAGNIICQRRPLLSFDDGFSDLFMKSCKCGFDLLKDNLNYIIDGKISKVSISERGKLYNKRDLTSINFDKANDNIKEVLSNYILNKEQVDKEIKIIEG